MTTKHRADTAADELEKILNSVFKWMDFEKIKEASTLLHTIPELEAEIEGFKGQIARLETIERRLGSYQDSEQLLKAGIGQRDQLIADQQAEIEALKFDIGGYISANTELLNELRALKSSSEPVAWMQTWRNQRNEIARGLNFDRIGKSDIALYAHPTKNVTDEDVDEIAKPFLKWIKETFGPEEKVIKDYRGFSKALLRKAT